MNILRFFVLICFMTFTVSCGQQKRYVTYKIKENETMKDVAKRLDMRTKDLMRLNPDVSRRPAENTTIIIPEKGIDLIGNNTSTNIKKDSIIAPVEGVTVTETRVTYETHTVQPKETVYSLTKKYEISKETLMAWNPDHPNLERNGLRIGEVLKVRRIEESSSAVIPTKEEEGTNLYVTHVVQPQETLFSLTQQYEITKEELIALNPNSTHLKDDNLTIGEILNIRPLSEELSNENKVYADNIQFGKTIKLALLLPFNASKYKETEAKDVFKGNKVANLITEYYLGAEMAIDSIKKQGVDVQAKVYDTGKKGAETSKIVSSGKLNDIDVVIGPFFSSKANIVANNVKVPVVFPHHSKKQRNFTSNKLVKSSPELEEYVTKLSEYLKRNYNGETIFVVGDGKASSDVQIRSLVANLQQHDSISSSDINVLKPEKNYIKRTRFTDKMKPKTTSWVILTSEDNAAVADVLNSFVVIPDDVKVQLFAVHKGKAYNKVDNNKLGRLGFIYVTDSFINEKDNATKVFNRKYKIKNKALPTPYALKGFDVTYDILVRLASGEKLRDTFSEGKSTRISSKFNYDTKFLGSTSNKGLFIVKYNKDLSLTELK